MKRIISLTLFSLALNLTYLSQSTIQTVSIENGWKGIKPLEANKTSVNKLLGKPEIDDNGYYGYFADGAFIQVNYSTAPCQENHYNRGKFDVSEDTVLDYSVNIKQVALSEIKFKRENYKRDASDHTNFAEYLNGKDGVEISVIIYGDDEYARQIRYRPSKKSAEKFKCKN